MFNKSTFVTFATLALFALSAEAIPAPAPANCPAAKTVTVTALPKTTPASKPAATKPASNPPPKNNAGNNQLGNFGRCSIPEIKFGTGFDGRREASFAPVDKKSFNHGSTQDINTLVFFVCQQVATACRGDFRAVQTCRQAASAALGTKRGGGQADAFNGKMGKKSNFGGGKGGAATTSIKATTTAKGGAATNTVKGGSGTTTSAAAATSTAANNGNQNNNNGDAQKSLTLDPAVIAKGFESDGQQVPTAGQVPSLTSGNNFINFCKTVNKPITNGQQITTGSCNPAPMGVIASTDNMPSSKFQNPPNFGTIKANTPFQILMAINHIQTGNFVNAQQNYYAAPQQINGAGDIIGHTHVVVEQIDSLTTTTVTDPKKFAFFKGVNGAAVNGVVSADVTNGLPKGFYRLASINAAMNHQPVLVAVAQHGTLDDMVYFTVTDDGAPAAGAPAANTTAAANNGKGAPATATASATAAANTAKGAASPTATVKADPKADPKATDPKADPKATDPKADPKAANPKADPKADPKAPAASSSVAKAGPTPIGSEKPKGK